MLVKANGTTGEWHNIFNDLPRSLILINFHFGISKLLEISMQPNV